MTHGMRYTSEYKAWESMKARCLVKTHKYFKHYGGRGIGVDQRWLKFENFFNDIGSKPNGMTLERINNDGNYGPSNCRWATRAEQSLNRRSVRMYTFNGKTLCIEHWAKLYKISSPSLRRRLRSMTIDQALTKPKRLVNGRLCSKGHSAWRKRSDGSRVCQACVKSNKREDYLRRKAAKAAIKTIEQERGR